MEMSILIKRMAVGISLAILALACILYTTTRGRNTRQVGFCWKVDKLQ